MSGQAVAGSTEMNRAPSGSGSGMWHMLRHDPLAQAMFLSLLLLGGDRLAIDIGGMHFRVVFPLLMATIGLLYLKLRGSIAFDKTLGFLFFAFALAGGISTINSGAPVKSVGYTIWVLFDFFIVISVFFNFARLYAIEFVLWLWLMVFRIQAVMVLLELARNLALRLPYRPQIWFYEPSYLAVFMTGYFGASLYLTFHKGRKHALDMTLAAVTMLTLSSATAVFGIIFATVFNILVARQRVKLLLWSAAIFGVLGSLAYALFGQTRYFEVIAGFFFQPDSLRLILERGGDRWLRVLIGLDAFRHHPWLGVGIGGDEAYMHIAEYPQEVIRLSKPWTDVRVGEPFCNIFVEILGTTGIVGFIPFMSVLGYAGWRMTGWAQKSRPPTEAVVFLVGFFSTLLAMQLDGTVLRYYVWSSLGLGLGVLARYRAVTDPAPAALAGPGNRL